MSRWSYGNWAMAAVVIDEDGEICPLSELYTRYGLRVEGYYEERCWAVSSYYALDDLTGAMDNRDEGSMDIYAHLRITDSAGVTREHELLCEGYTCCGEDCYMLLIVTPGADADTTTVDFQTVERVELIEAVGEKCFNQWWNSPESEGPRCLDAALF